MSDCKYRPGSDGGCLIFVAVLIVLGLVISIQGKLNKISEQIEALTTQQTGGE